MNEERKKISLSKIHYEMHHHLWKHTHTLENEKAIKHEQHSLNSKCLQMVSYVNVIYHYFYNRMLNIFLGNSKWSIIDILMCVHLIWKISLSLSPYLSFSPSLPLFHPQFIYILRKTQKGGNLLVNYLKGMFHLRHTIPIRQSKSPNFWMSPPHQKAPNL